MMLDCVRQLLLFSVLAVPLLSIAHPMEQRRSPQLPTQFQVELIVVSHLTDPSQPYPPSTRKMRIWYDLEQNLARADTVQGHEPDKTYIRRYDNKEEFMIKYGQYPKCERAYLGEQMPLPSLPSSQEFVGIENVRGIVCEHWLHVNGDERIHIYQDAERKIPIRLTQENIINRIPSMLLTYDFVDMAVGPQRDDDFEIPQGFSYIDCDRSVAGFPYIHAFHHYMRF